MESSSFSSEDRATRYREAVEQLGALCEADGELVSNLANASALLKDCIARASWVGFYLRRGEQLVLGPFQGKVACVAIEFGRGVCGTSAATREILVVPDVEAFPGHIACDAGSRSEIVVPVLQGDRVVAVLDVDSYELAAFDEVDAAGLGEVVKLMARWAW
ncbi:MAG: GAF domain-containing protein [Kofleriaceae bacterium]